MAGHAHTGSRSLPMVAGSVGDHVRQRSRVMQCDPCCLLLVEDPPVQTRLWRECPCVFVSVAAQGRAQTANRPRGMGQPQFRFILGEGGSAPVQVVILGACLEPCACFCRAGGGWGRGRRPPVGIPPTLLRGCGCPGCRGLPFGSAGCSAAPAPGCLRLHAPPCCAPAQGRPLWSSACCASLSLPWGRSDRPQRL